MYKQYLERLELLSEKDEVDFFKEERRTCFDTVYPFKIFPDKRLESVEFAPITIFYGGNGSGKSTLLNIIAEKTHITRHSPFSGSAFFDRYVSRCEIEGKPVPLCSEIICSDDVFDELFSARRINEGIDRRRNELFVEYRERRDRKNVLHSLSEYDEWKESADAQSQSQSRFVRDRLRRNVDMRSNGESAMKYFLDHIREDALYLMDEPENSLSVEFQQELSTYISSSAAYYGCQFVLATHSPILLSMENAVIYDLDAYPVCTRSWTELENVRRYFTFFEMHKEEFLEKR